MVFPIRGSGILTTLTADLLSSVCLVDIGSRAATGSIKHCTHCCDGQSYKNMVTISYHQLSPSLTVCFINKYSVKIPPYYHKYSIPFLCSSR